MALSSLSAVLSGGVSVFSGVPCLLTPCLAISGHAMELYGLPPLCLGYFPIETLFGTVGTLTKVTPPYPVLSGPAVTHPGLPLQCLTLFCSASPDSFICPTSLLVLYHFSPACPISPISNAFLFFMKQIQQTMVAFPYRVCRQGYDQTTK